MEKNQHQTNNTLIIGIPVRNEEATLPHFLRSFVLAINQLNFPIETEVIFCVNGSVDKSLDIIRSFKRRFNNLNVEIIESPEGKMQAQRHIINSSRLDGPVTFLDADILLDKDCLKKLWEALELDKNLQIAFAKVYPKCVNSSWLGRLQKAYYERDDDVRVQRRYIHGRAYILRSRHHFTIKDLQNRVGQIARKDEYYTKYFHLEKGPQADDIFLSRLIAHKFGVSSIKEVQDAIVFFVPPNTIRDCYEEQKRLIIEIARNDFLFPEYAYTQKSYFVRKLQWGKFKALGWPTTIHYFLYLPFVIGIRKFVRFRLMIGQKMKIGHGKFWVPLSSTKSLEIRK